MSLYPIAAFPEHVFEAVETRLLRLEGEFRHTSGIQKDIDRLFLGLGSYEVGRDRADRFRVLSSRLMEMARQLDACADAETPFVPHLQAAE